MNAPTLSPLLFSSQLNSQKKRQIHHVAPARCRKLKKTQRTSLLYLPFGRQSALSVCARVRIR